MGLSGGALAHVAAVVVDVVVVTHRTEKIGLEGLSRVECRSTTPCNPFRATREGEPRVTSGRRIKAFERGKPVLSNV